MSADKHHQLNVGHILQQLRDDIRAQRLAASSEDTALERELRQCLDDIELYRVVSAHWPLKKQSPMDRIVVPVNKVVRRLLRWYINPIVEQQNAYNDAVARAVRLLAESYAELKEQGQQGDGGMEQRGSRRVERGDQGNGGAKEATHIHSTEANLEPDYVHLSSDHTSPAPMQSPALRDHEHGIVQDANLDEHDGLNQASSALFSKENSQNTIQYWQNLVAVRAQQEPPAQFIELQLTALQPQLALRQNVQAHWPLEGHTLVQRLSAFIHKLMRQYLRWLINPIVEQQNHANIAISNVILLLVRVDEQRRAELARMRARR